MDIIKLNIVLMLSILHSLLKKNEDTLFINANTNDRVINEKNTILIRFCFPLKLSIDYYERSLSYFQVK
jgi:hypothetical protein